MAAACVYIPYVLLTKFPAIQSLVLFLAGIVMATTIVWSLVPQRDRFRAPGPRLQLEKHPRLLSELTAISASLNESPPREVYLTMEMNAWVAERGGTMGFGSRRVMGLGLPLVQVLTVSQLRAVLAHECAHFYGGDTRLGPWIYKTRDAMVRTLTSLTSAPMQQALGRISLAYFAYKLVVRGLDLYWRLFMRATQLISRRQELRADELACCVAGSQSFIGGMQSIHGASAVLPAFWRNEMVPALEAGYRLPIGEGFARFMAAAPVSQAVANALDTALKQSETAPFDTHPPLAVRVAAARQHTF